MRMKRADLEVTRVFHRTYPSMMARPSALPPRGNPLGSATAHHLGTTSTRSRARVRHPLGSCTRQQDRKSSWGFGKGSGLGDGRGLSLELFSRGTSRTSRFLMVHMFQLMFCLSMGIDKSPDCAWTPSLLSSTCIIHLYSFHPSHLMFYHSFTQFMIIEEPEKRAAAIHLTANQKKKKEKIWVLKYTGPN